MAEPCEFQVAEWLCDLVHCVVESSHIIVGTLFNKMLLNKLHLCVALSSLPPPSLWAFPSFFPSSSSLPPWCLPKGDASLSAAASIPFWIGELDYTHWQCFAGIVVTHDDAHQLQFYFSVFISFALISSVLVLSIFVSLGLGG